MPLSGSASPSNDDSEDFVLVDSEAEEAEEATESTQMTTPLTLESSESSSELRLNPTIINNLLLSYTEGSVSKNHEITDGSVVIKEPCEVDTDYKEIHRSDVPFVVFQVTRDSKKDDKTKNLAFINDVITEFLKENLEKKLKLLIPLAQCRLQVLRNKKHYVLVEINIDGENKEIVIHNSRSKLSTLGYPNCLKDLKDFKLVGRNHDLQEGDESCGLWIYRCVQFILEEGSAEDFKNIARVNLKSPLLDLDRMINDNLRVFKEKILNQAKKNRSFWKTLDNLDNLDEMKKDFEMPTVMRSVPLPWKRQRLMEFLRDYKKNLDIDIGPYDDEDMPEVSLARRSNRCIVM